MPRQRGAFGYYVSLSDYFIIILLLFVVVIIVITIVFAVYTNTATTPVAMTPQQGAAAPTYAIDSPPTYDSLVLPSK